MLKIILRTIGFLMGGYWLGYAAALFTDSFIPARSTVLFLALSMGVIVLVASFSLGGVWFGKRSEKV